MPAARCKRAEGRAIGAVAGAAGALIGTQAGYRIRTALARRVGRDWPVAVAGDAAAMGLSLLALRLAR